MQDTPTADILEPGIKTESLSFSHWPAFAAFIREHHMITYAKELLDLSRKADIPIMKLIAHMPEEQLLEMTIQGHGEFLENVEKNILREHLNEGLEKWEKDQLGIISNDDIAMEDITIGTFIRKKALLGLLPLYTSDPYQIIEIVKEIDLFDTEAINLSTNLYFKLLKKKEQKILNDLQESQKLYQQAQEMAHIGNWYWNIDTDQVIWSDEMFRIYDTEKVDGSMSRKDYLGFRHPDDNELIEAHIATLKETHEPQEYYFRIVTKKGVTKNLYAHAEAKLDADGKVVQLYGTMQDVTKEKNYENELHEKNEELQRSNNNLQDYAYITSHDLKEPLRKITTFSGLLLRSQSKELTDEGKVYLNKISDAGLRMQTMISDLLTISTISGNKAFEKYSLHKTAMEAIQRLEHKIEDSKAKIEVEDLPEAEIVPAQFRQLFQNLINNSLKFTRKGVAPEIKISSCNVSPEEVEERKLIKTKKYICINFTDNGIGFDNEYAERIFSIFQRLHGQSEYEGTGIGLSICKKVAENHGGIIYAKGKQGVGATFTIIIPA